MVCLIGIGGRGCLLVNNAIGTKEMAHWIKHLLWKYEDLSSDPSTHIQAKQSGWCTSLKTVPGSGRDERAFVSCWPDSIDNRESSKLKERPCLRNSCGVIEANIRHGTPASAFVCMLACAHTYTHTYMHKTKSAAAVSFPEGSIP